MREASGSAAVPKGRDPAGLPRWAPGALLAALLGLYLWGAAPGVTWEDSAAYLRTIEGGDAPWGAAQVYRLYFLLLKGVHTATEGSLRALNALHGLLSALCLYALYRTARALGAGRAGGCLAILALGLSHLFWHYAGVMKVYPLMNLCLLSTAWGLAAAGRSGETRPLLLSGAAFGLSLGTHAYALAGAPGFLLWAAAGGPRARRLACWGAGALAAGGAVAGLLYADLIATLGPAGFLRHWLLSGHSETLTGVSQGSELLSIRWSRLPRDLAEWALYLGYQLGPMLLIGWLGLRRVWRERRESAIALLAIYLSYAAVAFDFNVSLKVNFYLPTFLVAAVWCGLGLEPFLARLSPARRPVAALGALAAAAAAPPALYAATALWALPAIRPAAIYGRHDAGYKDRARFYLWPPKRGFDEPERFARRAFDTMPKGAVVVADFQESEVLRWAQATWKERPDLDIRHVSAWKGKDLFWRDLFTLSPKGPVHLGTVYRPFWLEGEAPPGQDFDPFRAPSGWAQVEVARLPSPEGDAEAVLTESSGGAEASLGHDAYLTRPGKPWQNGVHVASFYSASRNKRAAGANLRWDGPRSLAIECLRGRSIQLIQRGPALDGRAFSVSIRLGIVDEAAPPGPMRGNGKRGQ